MKIDKKLKQIVKKSEKQKIDLGFRQNVFDTYSEKPGFNFKNIFKQTWFKTTVPLALCSVVAISLFVGLNKKPNTLPTLTADVVVIDTYNLIEVTFNNHDGIAKNTAQGLSFDYGDTTIDFSGCNIQENDIYSNEDNGVSEYRYIYGEKDKNIFQVQLILNDGFEYVSQLTSSVKSITIKNVDFDYSIYYATNDKMFYVFGEAKTNSGAILVGFVTTQTNYEECFKSFLYDIIT